MYKREGKNCIALSLQKSHFLPILALFDSVEVVSVALSSRHCCINNDQQMLSLPQPSLTFEVIVILSLTFWYLHPTCNFSKIGQIPKRQIIYIFYGRGQVSGSKYFRLCGLYDLIRYGLNNSNITWWYKNIHWQYIFFLSNFSKKNFIYKKEALE